jgi:hypothetical protein
MQKTCKGGRSHACVALRRVKLAEGSVQQLRDDAAQAGQRAASAEVKVEVLQRAVQQAEERAAALEMRVSARMPCALCCAQPSGIVGVACNPPGYFPHAPPPRSAVGHR